VKSWAQIQEAKGIPLMERTYKAQKPNGEIVLVNRFDYNLMCYSPDNYIQCSDTSWAKHSNLTVLE